MTAASGVSKFSKDRRIFAVIRSAFIPARMASQIRAPRYSEDMIQLAKLAKVDTETPNTVLLVEDSTSLREALVVHLSKLDGLRVESAVSLAQVQELLAFGG